MNPIRSRVFGIALIVATLGVSAGLYQSLPDPVPTHWDLRGVPDGFTPKPLGAFIMPLVMTGVYLLFLILPKTSPHGFQIDRFAPTWWAVCNVILAFLYFVGLIALLSAAGVPLPADRLTVASVGLLLAILGNFMGKFTRNFFAGIRTPWTLASEEVWLRTHRLAGKLFVAGGLLIALAALIGAGQVGVGAIILAMVVIPVVYSYWIYRRLEGFGRENDRPAT
jgi:immunity protein, SdpI family